jgi:hypothetical protein
MADDTSTTTNEAPQLTPEAAWAELAKFMDDKQCLDDFAAGRPGAKRRFDELTNATQGTPKPAPPPPPPAPDPHEVNIGMTVARMTPAQQAAHAALFGPPPSPHDYKIHIGHELDEAGVQELASAQGFMHAAELPKKDGELLAELALQEGRKLEQMNPAQREQYRSDQAAKFRNAWGNDYDARFANVCRLLDEAEAKQPGGLAWLERYGLHASFAVIAHLERVARLRYGKGK